MSLNKTRKRAIAKARRREVAGHDYNIEQIAEAIAVVATVVVRFTQAIAEGIVAFNKAFAKSLEQ